jgi:hypothetical protein
VGPERVKALSDKTDEAKEQRYADGQRAALLSVLVHVLDKLGFYGPLEEAAAKWIIEREETIAALRAFCEEFGDNDWDPTLHLADILDKHLRKHIEADAAKGKT